MSFETPGELSGRDCFLIVLAGLPGCGKSTLAAAIANSLGFKLVSQNQVRRAQGMSRMPKEQDETLRLIDQMVCQSLLSGKGAIVDSVNRYLFRRHQLYGVASGCGKRVFAIECICDEATAKSRIMKRPEPDNLVSDPNSLEVYDRLAAAWQPIIGDFEFPGQDHVSYLVFNSQSNELRAEILPEGAEFGFQTINDSILELAQE